jgi:16S rRNA (guanine527-N7)-methyltransferase
MGASTIFSDSATRLFLEAARELSVPLSEEKIPLFEKYYKELLFWNKKVNLTRITAEQEVVVNHFLDSLVPERFISPGATVADIGAGAGFPGIPLKIVRPDLFVTLIEASFKKATFLRHVVRLLGLQDVAVRNGRVGEGGNWAPEFTCCIGRAVSGLLDFLSIARQIVTAGGSILAMRGARFEEELEDVKKALPGMNLSFHTVSSVVLPVTRAKRGVIVFRVEGECFT